jgi:hypothetical protein
VGGEVRRQCDETERGEDDADVADDVMLARDDAAEVGIRVGPEHAGEDEDRDGGEGDETDEHARLAQQQLQLERRETQDRSHQAIAAVARGSVGWDEGDHWKLLCECERVSASE